jgi:hypothetical protein
MQNFALIFFALVVFQMTVSHTLLLTMGLLSCSAKNVMLFKLQNI